MSNKNAEQLYLLAEERAKNEGLAFDEWVPAYQKSAELGYADAQFKMGQIYYHGLYSEYVNQHNYDLAFKWYSLAANQNHPHAQSFLSKMYEKGQGVPQSNIEAKNWHAKALSNGCWMALKEEKENKLFFSGLRGIFGLF